jgi:hypothetical protein
MWLSAFVGLLLACGGPCAAQAQSSMDLIWFLTGQSYRPDRGPEGSGLFSCGQVVADHRAGVALAKLGDLALPDIEHELDAIETHAHNPEFGSDWLELAYAKIKGSAAYSRLRKMEAEADPGRQYLDRAIALSLGLTSFVSASKSVTSKFPYQCRKNTDVNTASLIVGACRPGTHAEQLMNIHCDRYEEPLDALNQFIGALETNDEIFFELQLGPDAKAALDALLEGRTWDNLRAAILQENKTPGDLAVGYRFEIPGRWSEPAETLEENSAYAGRPPSAALETHFKTRSGADCGRSEVHFLLTPTDHPDSLTPYLVNNSDLAGLLAVIGSCAKSE